MKDGDLEFPKAPLSPSLPSDFLEPVSTLKSANNISKNTEEAHTSPSKVSQAKNVEKSSLESSALSGSHKAAHNVSPEDAKKIKDMKSGMGRWIEKARVKKHNSDRANELNQHRNAILLALDSLICFMIAFDYEDRGEAIKSGSPIIGKPTHARSWCTLIPFLAKVAAKAESIDADLGGACYLVCAVVRLHVAHLQRRTSSAADVVKDLYLSMADFRRGLHLLPHEIARTRYNLNAENGWTKIKIDATRPNPKKNRAVLPLHVNSLLAEAAAFALQIGQTWAEQEGIDYAWEAVNEKD